MSQLIDDVIAKFGNSEPIFVAKSRYDDTEIEFEIKNPYSPDTNIDDMSDPIEKIIAERYYSEHFSRDEKRFVKSISGNSVHSHIVCTLRKIYEDYSPLKNPSQSKLYKWLYNMQDQYKHESSAVFIALYRYAATHKNGQEFKFDGGDNNVHVKNILAILSKIKDKYEQ